MAQPDRPSDTTNRETTTAHRSETPRTETERREGVRTQDYRQGDDQQHLGGDTIEAGRGMLSGVAEATGDLASTAVREVVNVGEEVIHGVGRLASDGVVEISRFLVIAASGLRGAISTVVTGRTPTETPWLHADQGSRGQSRRGEYRRSTEASGREGQTVSTPTSRSAQPEQTTHPGTTI
jgi:hypothetical protein